uniref:ZP domain-containing protein n=1 Tax=Knipowitschia caucasica TaxID=637954 RepID=A0AAV2J126_KNICA
MMLLLLLSLSAQLLFSGAQVFNGPNVVDISMCPIAYYGTIYTELQLFFRDNKQLSIHFGRMNGSSLVNFIDIKQPLEAETVTMEVISDLTVAETVIKESYSHISTSSTCGIRLKMTLDMATRVSNTDVDFIVNSDQSATLYSGGGILAVDLTGCQHQDQSYWMNAKVTDLCLEQTCLSTGLWSAPAPTCLDSESCFGDNLCGMETTCVAFGNSMVDFTQMSNQISNFCNNTLLLSPDFTVTGSYASRRNTEVPFLQSVNLTTTGYVTLKHGGVVLTKQENGEEVEVDLSSSVVTLYGVELSKSPRGVSATFTDSTLRSFTVLYDGTLLSINMKAPRYSSLVSGLCQGFAPPGSNIDWNLSEDNCDVVVPDSDKDDIDCDAVTERCSAELTSLKDAFGCHFSIAPFVDSCSRDLLCLYPEEDGLLCAVKDAFATTKTLSPCVDHACADHEFCAINAVGDPACFCQDIVATPYRTAGTYGDVSCDSASVSASLLTCFLEEKGVEPSTVHLLDPRCTSVSQDQSKSLRLDFSSTNLCGGTINDTTDQVVFSNIISNTVNSSADVVMYQNPLSIHLSCAYKPTITTATITISDGSVTLVYPAGEFLYNITISLFTDEDLSMAVGQDTTLLLNQKLWVQLEAEGVGGSDLALFIQDSWATPSTEPTDSPRHDIITQGCENSEDSVDIISNGVSLTSVFAFRLFEFIEAPSAGLSLHCQLRLCIVGSSCTMPTCA